MKIFQELLKLVLCGFILLTIILTLARSSYYYKSKEKKPDDPVLLKRIEELAEEFSRFGYRRMMAQLHREMRFNHKGKNE